jgi:hypothetical protein
MNPKTPEDGPPTNAAKEPGETVDPSLTKAEASRMIVASQSKAGRGRGH